jgi:alkylated DNA repair protein alkB homolog 6
MPHEDGAAYHPVVATVSLGGSLVLNITEKVDHTTSPTNEASTRKTWRIFQEPRSLLVTTGSAYTDTLHGIAEIKEDVDLNEKTVANWDLLGDREVVEASRGRNERTTRISLTYRDVLKVSNLGAKIFGRQRT